MALIIDGILTQKLPWGLVLLGVFIAIGIELWASQSLPFAVGVYLPLSTSSPMFAGGLVRWLVERRKKASNQSIAEVESGPGVLFSSGLIAGGAIAGIAVAGLATVFASAADKAGVPAADYLAHRAGIETMIGKVVTGGWQDFVALGVFVLLGALLFRVASREPAR